MLINENWGFLGVFFSIAPDMYDVSRASVIICISALRNLKIHL